MATDELALTLDHVSLSVADLARSRDFYEKLLASIGLEIVADLSAEVAGVACTGFGRGRKGTFWLAENGQQSPQFHVCFRAKSRKVVREFHTEPVVEQRDDDGQRRGESGVELCAVHVSSPVLLLWAGSLETRQAARARGWKYVWRFLARRPLVHDGRIDE